MPRASNGEKKKSGKAEWTISSDRELGEGLSRAKISLINLEAKEVGAGEILNVSKHVVEMKEKNGWLANLS